MGIGEIGGRPAVFLDRDGVLLVARVVDGLPFPPADKDDAELTQGAATGCRRLKEYGFLLVVVTNQPDVARGTTTREAVERINDLVQRSLGIDSVRVCYHDDADRCYCRKPKPGLLLDAAADYQIDLGASYLIGDRWKDIEAGRRAGCATVFIDCRYREALQSPPTTTVGNFTEAVNWILRDTTGKNKEARNG